MTGRYKNKFDEIVLENRWKLKRHRRNCDWVIIGISKNFFSATMYEYKISLFGFEIRIFMEREFIKSTS